MRPAKSPLYPLAFVLLIPLLLPLMVIAAVVALAGGRPRPRMARVA